MYFRQRRFESGNFTRSTRLRRQEIALQVATFVSTNSEKMVGTRSCARFEIRLVDLHGNPIRDQHGRIAVSPNFGSNRHEIEFSHLLRALLEVLEGGDLESCTQICVIRRFPAFAYRAASLVNHA